MYILVRPTSEDRWWLVYGHQKRWVRSWTECDRLVYNLEMAEAKSGRKLFASNGKDALGHAIPFEWADEFVAELTDVTEYPS